MAPAPVRVDRVWKKFVRGEHHDSLRDLVSKGIPGLFRRKPETELSEQEFWALRDVSFEVKPGEALGVIGPNGAGKSTLLKVLSRILRPTTGVAAVTGRVGALIEVAAGFHPDLTGRENIFLQGAIMGMRRTEIARQLDAIIDFAGTHEFTDTPIKRYSSGMNARLGFSIAAHLEPSVLLIDEVLAVGDMAFQKRCYERMQRFKDRGVALVFISHNLPAIASLCDRVLVLDRGRVLTIDTPDAAIAKYAGHSPAGANGGGEPSGILTITGTDGRPRTSISAGDEIIVKGRMPIGQAASMLTTGISMRHLETGEKVFATNGASIGLDAVNVGRQDTIDVEWRLAVNLSNGHYCIDVWAFDTGQREVLGSLTAPHLTVTDSHNDAGVAHLPARCAVQVLSGRPEPALA